MGRGVGPARRPAPGGDRTARSRVDRCVRRQSGCAQPLVDDVHPGAADRARDPQPLQRVDRRSDAPTRRVGPRVRFARGDTGTRSGPDRSPRDPRSEPVCVERQRVHRSGLPGSDRSDPGAWWEDRGGRPPPVAHRRAGRPVGQHPPRHRCAVAGGDRERDARRRHRRRRRSRARPRRRCRSAGPGARTVHARSGRIDHRHRCRDDQVDGARTGRRTGGDRVRPHRYDDDRIRLDRVLARGRRQHVVGQSRPTGRGHVRHAGRRRRHHTRQTGERQGASPPGVVGRGSAVTQR